MSHRRPHAPDPAAGGELPPWREPVRGGYPDPRHWRLSGVELLRAMVAGRIAQPPISRLTGMRLVDIGAGSAAFAIPLTGWLCSPQGAISIGPLAMPSDGAVACAIQTELPPATPFTTSELSLRLLSPVAPGGTLTARGRLIQLRRRLALAEVAVTDEDDRMIAHGSSLCFVAPQVSPAPEPPAVPPAPEPPAVPRAPEPPAVPRAPEPPAGPDTHAGPDPCARPPQGEVLGQDVWERLSGLEVLLAQLAGELPLPPIHYLTGLTLLAAAPGEVTFTMPASEWFCAPPRERVQGGSVALLAEAALSSAIQAQLPAATAVAPVDLKVNYLRPLVADGRAARADGHVVHAGRRIAVARAEVLDADGKPVAVATGSAMILPGREASLGATGG
ncbi:MAG TPA: PaaI family thioesterase [Solirubrobacteraceae bacterium]|nr:PaaI family thioesterase [Solirubrobacteraceae bacterium]